MTKAKPVNIASTIKTARLALGMTMHELAAKIAEAEGSAAPLAWQTVQQWEAGLTTPRHKRLTAVASVLNLTVPRLLGIEATNQTVATRTGVEDLATGQPSAGACAHEREQVLREAISAIAQTESRKQAIEALERLIKP